MKTIAIFLPSLNVGGAERVVVTLANYFVEQNFHVEILLLKNKGDLRADLNENIKLVDLKCTNLKKEFFGLFKLRRYLKNNNIDCLMCVMWPLTIVGVLAKFFSRSNVNLILSDHTTFSKTPWIQHPLKKLIFRLSVLCSYPFANYRLNVSDNAAQDLEKLGWLSKNSINTIHNPIQIYTGEINHKNSEVKTIISVGSLKWVKNHELLLNSFKMLTSLRSDIELLIVGEGSRRANIEKLITEYDLSNNVTLLGQKNAVELEQVYLSSDLFVLTSHYEGFSMVIAEALNHGLPVVSVNCPNGPSDILENGKYGTLVPVNDPNTLALAMNESLNKEIDPNFLRSRAKDFTVDKIGRQYLSIMFPTSN